MEKTVKKSIRKHSINYIILFISFLSIIGCVLKFDIYNNKIIFNGNNYLYILLFIGYFYLLKDTIKVKEKRLNIISIMFACFLTIIFILSFLTSNYFLNNSVPTSKTFICFIIIKTIAIFVLFYVIIKKIYIKLSKLNIPNKENTNEIKIFTNNKRSIFFVALLIFLIYIPFVIDSYPGNLTYDFAVQIRQGINNEQLVNHHPYIHTKFIRIMHEFW